MVQFSRSVVSDSLWPHESQHARPPCPSPTPGVHSDSGPSSQWCHPAISSSVIPFTSCPQSLPASGSFPVSQLLAWGGQSIGVSGGYLKTKRCKLFTDAVNESDYLKCTLFERTRSESTEPSDIFQRKVLLRGWKDNQGATWELCPSPTYGVAHQKQVQVITSSWWIWVSPCSLPVETTGWLWKCWCQALKQTHHGQAEGTAVQESLSQISGMELGDQKPRSLTN